MALTVSNFTPSDMQLCLEKHQTVDLGIAGKLNNLTMVQKLKLSTLIDEWITKVTAVPTV